MLCAVEVALCPAYRSISGPNPASVALYSQAGEALPAETFEATQAADTVLLDAMRLPDVRIPDGTEVQGCVIIRLRKALDLYAGVRPIR